MTEHGIDWNMVAAIAAVAAVLLTVIIALIGTVWKFSQAVDRNTIAFDNLAKTVAAQWSRIDEHGTRLDDHGNRIVKVETRLDYHENKESAR